MKRAGGLALVAVAAVLRCAVCSDAPPPPVRFATFNIENFPKNARQVANAFAEMARLEASAIAVQEISDPDLFAQTARETLGPSWVFVHVDTRPRDASLPAYSHHNGVVFDARTWKHTATLVHDETRIQGRHKPTLEVRLEHRRTGEPVRMLVVHLKSGGDYVDVRERQIAALETVVRKHTDPTILLGDFNATGDRDRRNLARLGRVTKLVWTTEPLACSAFWSRDDGCYRSRLDHVFSTRHASHVEARGGCATYGCEPETSCPRYVEDVSDHCPVVVTFD